MPTIRVVLEAKLLKAADLAAKRQKTNRSALIRDALRGHLKRLRERELEEQERRAYLAQPQREDEYRPREEIAALDVKATPEEVASKRKQLIRRREKKYRIVKAISQSTEQFQTGRYEGPED